MTKAWDVKDLAARMAKEGLPVVEDGAVRVINVLIDWVGESVQLSENKMDDLVLMGLPMLRDQATKLAHKIAQGKGFKADDQADAQPEEQYEQPEEPAQPPILNLSNA